MWLKIPQIAKILNYTPQGTLKLLKRLQLPLRRQGKVWLLNTRGDSAFVLSLRLQHQYPETQVLYSIAQLAAKHHRDKKTMLRLLAEAQVPLRGSSRKRYVYLWDLYQLRKQAGKSRRK